MKKDFQLRKFLSWVVKEIWDPAAISFHSATSSIIKRSTYKNEPSFALDTTQHPAASLTILDYLTSKYKWYLVLSSQNLISNTVSTYSLSGVDLQRLRDSLESCRCRCQVQINTICALTKLLKRFEVERKYWTTGKSRIRCWVSILRRKNLQDDEEEEESNKFQYFKKEKMRPWTKKIDWNEISC